MNTCRTGLGRLVILTCFVAAAFRPSPGLADRPSGLTLSGFATVGAVSSDRKDVWFTRFGVNFPGDHDPDFSPDSLLGLQASLLLTDHNDVTLQILAREDGTETVEPRVTLAFFRQALGPGLAMRIGRLRVPFFMLSDSLHLNYANPWVRPPVEVYGLNPFNDLDGIDLIYHARLGETDLELQPYYGNGGDIPFPDGKARLREAWGMNVVLSRGSLTLHLGHGDGRFELQRGGAPFSAFAAGLTAAGLGDVVPDLSGTRGRTSFDSVGLQWDDGDWQLVGEYVRRTVNRYVTSSSAWYLSIGRRFGSLTPYVSVARQRLDDPIARATIPAGSALAAGWQIFQTSRNNAQRSITAGMRWDVSRMAALKAEVTRARPDSDAWGSYFARSDPLTTPIGGRIVHTFSVSLDLAF
jgi:hypothetical protein